MISLVFLALAQDSSDVARFFETPTLETAQKAKAAARRFKDDDPIRCAIYVMLADYTARETKTPSADQKRVFEHLRSLKLGELSATDHMAYAQALGLEREPQRLIALAHLEAARAKVPSSKESETIVELRKFAAEGKVEAIAGAETKDATFAVKYFRMWGLLKSVGEHSQYGPELIKQLEALKADPIAKAHVEALLKKVRAYVECESCKGRREVKCEPCGGKGVRETICAYCKGAGKFATSANTFVACGACGGNPKTNLKCNFCAGRGFVACERCKYLVPTYEDIVKETPCQECRSRGFHFGPVVCVFCKGLGTILRPVAAPDKLVFPPE